MWIFTGFTTAFSLFLIFTVYQFAGLGVVFFSIFLSSLVAVGSSLLVLSVKTRPRLVASMGMSFAWLVVCLVVLGVLYGGVQKNGDLSEMQPTQLTVSSRQEMVSLINRERQAAGLVSLTVSDKLNASAEDKACDMRDREYFGHLDPDNREAWYLFDKHDYHYAFAGENLIEGFTGDEQSLAALMASQPHRVNILSENFTQIGVGRCGEFTVQHFATPKVE